MKKLGLVLTVLTLMFTASVFAGNNEGFNVFINNQTVIADVTVPATMNITADGTGNGTYQIQTNYNTWQASTYGSALELRDSNSILLHSIPVLVASVGQGAPAPADGDYTVLPAAEGDALEIATGIYCKDTPKAFDFYLKADATELANKRKGYYNSHIRIELIDTTAY